MAKKKIDIDKYVSGLFLRTEQYADKVRRHYASAVDELLKISANAKISPEETFSFADNKKMSGKANEILRGLYSAVYNEIKNGVAAEWEYANISCDALIESIFGKGLEEDDHFARWFSRNQEAMDAFFTRKSAYGGMNLSQKVWKYTGELKTEMELALSLSLGEGNSASKVSKEVRKYLQEPERLFRRIKIGTDADGNPRYKLSKAAKAYHPGRGVYRSSYKNAMRLTRTETNMAYKTAEQDRWQRMDFVVGYEIKTSNNHPEHDICDELKGKYPKDFVFKGWHPQCRCYVVPILAEQDEFVNMQKKILDGEDITNNHYLGEITEVPEKFNKWIDNNRKRIEKAGSLPYFIKDNFVDGDINKMLVYKTRHKYNNLSKAAENLNVDSVIIQQPQKPTFNYSPDNKNLTFEERASNIMDGLYALFGTNENIPTGYEKWWDYIKTSYNLLKERNASSIAFDTHIITYFNKYAKFGFSDQLETIIHWNELANSKNLYKIPAKWRNQFNYYIKKIEATDIVKAGYNSVYREIEAAYNIYKLSNSTMAVKYGLDKISPKMPHQLFEELFKKTKIDITKTMPLKEFFDSLEEFVPLSTIGASGDGCYFSPVFKHVRIPFNIKSTKDRLIESEIYRTKVIYHEFGHARDCMSENTWRNSQEWKNLYKKFSDEINKDNGKALEEALRAKAKTMGGLSGMSKNDIEQLGAYADTLQSLVKGHRYVWNFGHSVSYWKGDKTIAEFIAHASENYWGGNDIFKELYPELYDEMCKLMKSM